MNAENEQKSRRIVAKIGPALSQNRRCVLVGMTFALVQLIGRTLFESDFGAELLLAELVLAPLAIVGVTVWLVGICQRTPTNRNVFYDYVDTVRSWVLETSSRGALILFGFALVALCTSSMHCGLKLVIASIAIASLGEMAANFHRDPATYSLVYTAAWATVVVTPLTF